MSELDEPIVPMRRDLVQRLDDLLRAVSAEVDFTELDELAEEVDELGRQVTAALR